MEKEFFRKKHPKPLLHVKHSKQWNEKQSCLIITVTVGWSETFLCLIHSLYLIYSLYFVEGSLQRNDDSYVCMQGGNSSLAEENALLIIFYLFILRKPKYRIIEGIETGLHLWSNKEAEITFYGRQS